MERTRRTSRTGGVGRISLARDETMRLPVGRRGLVVRLERGTLVVTQAGDPEDHVLRPGEAVHLAPRGLAVAWALAPSVLSVGDAAHAVHAEPCEAAA